MIWVIGLIISTIPSFLMYSQRFSSRTIKGFPLTQFCYLFISAPLISVCLINIAFSVVSRPADIQQTASDPFLLSAYIFLVVTGAIGVGIHSLAVTVEEPLSLHERMKAYLISKRVHGLISHEMLYISLMGISYLLVLLELNHPLNQIETDPLYLVSVGLICGFLVALSILWSTYIRINIFVCSVLLVLSLPFIARVINNPGLYPASVISLTTLSSTFVILLCATAIYLFLRGVCKRCVMVLFPPHHSVRKELGI